MATETENPPVTAAESLTPTRGAGSSMLDRWVEGDPDAAVKRVEAMVRMLEQLRLASIRATYPSDWIIHVSRDTDGNVISQRGYLQDIGAERAGKIWGIELGMPAIEDKTSADGTCSTYMIAEAWSKVTGERLDYVEGARWSGDPFFRKSVGPDEKVDPTDVRKSAYANLHGRAVRALSGLNGVPLETLKTAGLDVTKVVMVDYNKGGKGGESTGASVGTADAVVAFGRSQGKKPSELGDKDLDWYIGAYAENVASPEKAKFLKANQRILDALKAEKDRRGQSEKHAEEVGEEAGSGETAPTPRGKLTGDVWARLTDAAGKQAIPLLTALTKEMFSVERKGMSDCTDEELAKLAAVPDDNLKRVAATLGKKA